MLITGFDLETTGLDPEKDKVTEVGAVMWDTKRNAPIKFFSRLIKISIPVPEFITKLTGIDDDLLNTHGEHEDLVWKDFNDFVRSSDYLMAHNAPFDASFVAKPLPSLGKRYIDSSVDIEYPEHIQTRKLTHLACEHGFVNPFAHRAVTDVLSMMQIASKYDWDKTIASANTPNVTLQAMVDYGNNDKAKSNGYRWEPKRKAWLKQIKENKVSDEIAKCFASGFVSKRIA